MTEISICRSKRSVERLNVIKTVSSEPTSNKNNNSRKTYTLVSCNGVKPGKVELDGSLDNLGQSGRCFYTAYPRFGLNFDHDPAGRLHGGDDSE
jgi:hypothetical protein